MPERMRKVNEALREVVSDTLPELKDPRIGFVTVTGVSTSRDLRHATVFVSVLGSDRKREKALEGFDCRARAAAGADRTSASPQAHADLDVRVRPHRRRGRPDVKVDR